MIFRTKADLDNHPCFNKKASASYGRVHLPVAPHCNIQCNFCNRIYDCANENRPGVTAKVQTPDESVKFLENSLNLDKTYLSSASLDLAIRCATLTRH